MSISFAKAVSASFLLLLTAACGGGNSGVTPDPATDDALRTHVLEYWDGIRTDSLDADAMEQHTVDFLFLVQHADSATRSDAWTILAELPGMDIPDKTTVDYLREADSPLYSPAMLDEYLTKLMQIIPENDARLLRVNYLLECTRKNRPGDIIADISLKKPDGTSTTLHRLLDGINDECLLMLYDPECGTCDSVIGSLAAFPPSLPVIAVSISSKSEELPADWISATSSNADALDSAFHIHALPSFYLISADNKVVQSDITMP